MSQTFGQHMLNSLLPEGHKTTDILSKSSLNKKLTLMAKENSQLYTETVSKLKHFGDEISTLEGVSVGLDDITPEYARRDAILGPAAEKLKHEPDSAKRETIILKLQDQMTEMTKTHPGSMTAMALYGARGNIPQLMKTVVTPVASVDGKGALIPWLHDKSYSEGLSAASYWVAGTEARNNTIKSATSVAEPGDLAKILTSSMYDQVITADDCGTHNGIAFPLADSQVLGRYLCKDQEGVKRNTLVTPDVAGKLKKHATVAYVRSPMTCEERHGVCRHCYGLDEKGNLHQVGVNVGVRASNAMAEPLTQFSLNAKHGVRVIKGASSNLEGIAGLRQLVEVPQSFVNKATLAEKDGKVEKIEEAPHGGYYVTVAGTVHYVSPHLKVLVHLGQAVEAGDVLSEGIPKPDEIVHHKGLGHGRAYLVNALHNIYLSAGTNLDKRHLEILARSDLSHVKILTHSEEHPELLKGDLVPYGHYLDAIREHLTPVSLAKAEGAVLGKGVLHFTAGSPITASMISTLQHNGIKTVEIDPDAPQVASVMRPMTRTPLLNPDWLARLSHRYLKQSLLQGAHIGDATDFHSTHPVPAYISGSEFGSAPDGRY
jgi:DNA-directed RNA polymerase subunit beta'